VSTEHKAIFAVARFLNSSTQLFKPAWYFNSSKLSGSRVNIQVELSETNKVLLISLHEIQAFVAVVSL